MGLRLQRDRLCVVQLSAGDGTAHVVHFPDRNYSAPNLRRVLADPKITKIFHFARFDLAMIQRHFGIVCRPVYCTRTASKLVRTNTERHGLKDLCLELLGVELSKQQQTSDWGAPDPRPAAARLCRRRRAASARAAREAGRAAGARRPDPSGPGLLRLSSRPCRARSGRLGRGRHFRALIFAVNSRQNRIVCFFLSGRWTSADDAGRRFVIRSELSPISRLPVACSPPKPTR